MADESLDGIAIRTVDGRLVAWFADAEDAEEWARENHFGQWLAHKCAIPNRPPFTPEELEAARVEGEKLWQKLGEPRELEE